MTSSFSALLAICAGNSPVPGEFPTQRPMTRSFDVFFYLRPNKRLSKQWWGWWFETPSCPLWCHCNVFEQVVESTDEIPVIWDAVTLLWNRPGQHAVQNVWSVQEIWGRNHIALVHNPWDDAWSSSTGIYLSDIMPGNSWWLWSMWAERSQFRPPWCWHRPDSCFLHSDLPIHLWFPPYRTGLDGGVLEWPYRT